MDPNACLDSVYSRKVDVHQDQIGLELSRRFDRVLACGSLADHLEPACRGHHLPGSRAKCGLIIDDQYLDLHVTRSLITARSRPKGCQHHAVEEASLIDCGEIGAMTIRLVIADDSYIVREGVRELLGAVDELKVVGVCADLDSLRATIEAEKPDVVLTDIRMPPTNTDEGIRIAEELRQTAPKVGVVVLSQYADSEYALALLQKGAAGRAYLLKERVSDLDQLVNAIRDVAKGGSVIDPKVVENLIAARTRQARSPLHDLTSREREVLSEVAEGKNNAAIAEGLHLTERAVEKHINSIFSKLGLTPEQAVHRRVKAALLYLSDRC